MDSSLPDAIHDQLRHLREIHAQLATSTAHLGHGARANDALRRTLEDAAGVAADHARRLPHLLDSWTERGRRIPVKAPPQAADVPNRELVESWIEIADGARLLYEQAAVEAPTDAIAAEFRRLGGESAGLALRLRSLL